VFEERECDENSLMDGVNAREENAREEAREEALKRVLEEPVIVDRCMSGVFSLKDDLTAFEMDAENP
jgi:hypothetical protein